MTQVTEEFKQWQRMTTKAKGLKQWQQIYPDVLRFSIRSKSALTVEECRAIVGPHKRIVQAVIYSHRCVIYASGEALAQNAEEKISGIGVCIMCGCTDNDCRQCIERTGEPCHWFTPSLCSACAASTNPPQL